MQIRKQAISFLKEYGRADLSQQLEQNPLLPASEVLEKCANEDTHNCSASLRMLAFFAKMDEETSRIQRSNYVR